METQGYQTINKSIKDSHDSIVKVANDLYKYLMDNKYNMAKNKEIIFEEYKEFCEKFPIIYNLMVNNEMYSEIALRRYLLLITVNKDFKDKSHKYMFENASYIRFLLENMELLDFYDKIYYDESQKEHEKNISKTLESVENTNKKVETIVENISFNRHKERLQEILEHIKNTNDIEMKNKLYAIIDKSFNKVNIDGNIEYINIKRNRDEIEDVIVNI